MTVSVPFVRAVVQLVLGASLAAFPQLNGWRQNADTWEYVDTGQVVALIKAAPRVEPGRPFVFLARFNVDGDLISVAGFRYLGRDDTGITIEKKQGIASDEMRRAYRSALAANPVTSHSVNVRGWAVSKAMVEDATAGFELQTLRLPSPPAELTLGTELGVPLATLTLSATPGATTLTTVFVAPERRQ